MSVPLVCLPGLLCTPAVWDDTLAAAGLSAHVPMLTASDRMERVAEDVLRGSPGRFVLAGHSMGGYVAFEIMRLAPERVAGLFLSSTSARADDEGQRARRGEAVEKARAVGMSEFAASIARFLLHPQSAESPIVRERMVKMAEAVGFETFARHQQAIAGRSDHRGLLASVKCPTTVIVGASDRITPPAQAEEIVSLLPGAELGVIAGAAHMTLIENPLSSALALSELLQTVGREAAHA
ncbi:MAG TPA: alpha/beta hydrolase [Xanthobacteraceae bacterium]|nr:alpha/beta hydrolase [Xanthobacteraceae bacterium]